MIILDENRLSQFFKSVSSGFERSLSEILLVIILLLAFMSFLILMYRIQKAKANREHIRRSQAEYEKLLLKFDLGPTEQNLIKRLAEFLKIPDKKYLLLLNQATFNSCVGKLREKEEILAVALTGLRLKLGFTAQDPEKILSSSAELPEGMSVVIRMQEGEKIPARILKSEPQSLLVRQDEKAALPRRGTPLTLYFQNRSGVFAFSSHVQSNKDGALRLDHSDKIKRYQRRAYYRKRVMLPVFIKPAGSEERPLESILLDLGGGGASLKNPNRSFKPGMDLELSFHPEGESRMFIIAEVLRISKNGTILHLRFGPLKETTRDRIIGSLFHGKK